jgi:hypothetical protein
LDDVINKVMGGNRKILLVDREIGRIAGLGEKSASKVSLRVWVDNSYMLSDKYPNFPLECTLKGKRFISNGHH